MSLAFRLDDPRCAARPLTHREKRLREAAVDWVMKTFASNERFVFAVTLTCRQALIGPEGNLVWLTRESLSQAISTFARRIDWQVFKNASKRGGKRLERFCVIEGGIGTGKRLHLHMLILAPPASRMHPIAFVKLVRNSWVSSPWGLRDIRFDLPTSTVAAARYLTKTGIDAIDWHSAEFDRPALTRVNAK